MNNRKSRINIFSDREAADMNLLKISKILKMKVDEIDIENIFSDNADADQALNFLERYIKRYVNEFDGKKLSSIPHHLDLVRLFGQSEYYAGVLLRREDIHRQLFSENGIETTFSVRTEDEYFSSAPDNGLKNTLYNLRLYKEKFFFEIGYRNIIRKVNLEDTVRDLSLLADFVIQNILYLSKLSLKEKYDIEDDSFCILSVGKLGGMELNYSSDVDLLYVYNDIDTNYNSRNRQDSFSYYSELAGKITKTLSDNDDLLQMYRVDLRLRPDGEAGPIVRDVAGYIRYYERSGQTFRTE